MNINKPGVLFLQDSFSSEIRTQDLKKDNLPREERTRLITEALANVKNITKPGINPIKQMELATKWCPLVPDEFRDDICPIPPKDIVEKYAKDKHTKKGRPEKKN